ncbi:hypothetical protein SAMN05444581_10261 [Methylocapsa palsarum]|uniref:Uncharacterized protein n=1 Tax=Methylocapsa palsarum TaxID=1612308 RepID=A0A1I3WRB9_9HYPH|nr:hypothetical protein SAMN05444581_10261 [Methylocapsa palsarum]
MPLDIDLIKQTNDHIRRFRKFPEFELGAALFHKVFQNFKKPLASLALNFSLA